MPSVPVLCSLLLATAFSNAATSQTIQINRDNKTIAISTTDEASAVADIAAISVGFEIFRPDADAASAEGSRLSHTIMDGLHKAGVQDKSIESKSQSPCGTGPVDCRTRSFNRSSAGNTRPGILAYSESAD